MKVLLDSCVWGKAALELRGKGHDVVSVDDWGKDPGDEQILLRGAAEARVVVTLDKDFGELAVLRGLKHCGIIRLVDISAKKQAESV